MVKAFEVGEGIRGWTIQMRGRTKNRRAYGRG